MSRRRRASTTFSAGAVAVPGARRDVRIVPGVAQRERRRARRDARRGNAACRHLPACTAPAPAGLHARHAFEMGARSRDGAVAGFRTWLTGELFSVLSAHSILRHALGATPAQVSPDDPVFRHGCDDGLAASGRRRLAAVPHPRRDAAARHAARTTLRQRCPAC